MPLTLRARRPPHRSVDAVLAATLAVVGQVQIWAGWDVGGIGAPPATGGWEPALLVLFSTVPLAWRRSRPLPVAAVVCAAVAAHALLTPPYVPLLAGLLPMCIANYTVAAAAPRWRPGGLVLILGAEAVFFARIPEERVPGELLFALFVAVGTWLAGDVVRTWLSRAEREVGAAHELLAERAAEASAALADERARIARELHDVIAHSVSVMGVQAGAARTLLDTDPDAARDALRSIETTARESVAELQRLLAVLRDRDDAPGGRAPQPGLTELPRLVEQVRAAGLPVQLSVSGAAGLAPGVDLAAYRIVQEALTNALKHARAPTSVTVQRSDGEVCIEVRDTGTGRPPAPRPGGHGLVGMRERAQLYGGSLDACAHPEGGFVVRARLPVAADAP